MAKRTLAQMVKAVNKVIGEDSVVAARRIQSRDTVLMFTSNTEGYTKETK